VKPIKKALKAKLAKKAASKKAGAKTKAGARKKPVGRTARAAKNRFAGKAKPWIPWHSHRRDWDLARAGNQRFAGIVQPRSCGFRECGRVARGRNAFEADAVKGVQDAGDANGKEVHTHEVPQDDVPRVSR